MGPFRHRDLQPRPRLAHSLFSVFPSVSSDHYHFTSHSLLLPYPLPSPYSLPFTAATLSPLYNPDPILSQQSFHLDAHRQLSRELANLEQSKDPSLSSLHSSYYPGNESTVTLRFLHQQAISQTSIITSSPFTHWSKPPQESSDTLRAALRLVAFRRVQRDRAPTE